MVLGDIFNHKEAILNYFHAKNNAQDMLMALSDDLAVDTYHENQLVEEGILSEHFEKVNKYENILNALNVASVFGDVYINASEKARQEIDYYINAMEKIYSENYVMESTQIYQSFNLIDKLYKYNPIYKDLELSHEITDKIVFASKDICSTMLSWDEETETIVENINTSYLSEKYFLDEIKSVPNTLEDKFSVVYFEINGEKYYYKSDVLSADELLEKYFNSNGRLDIFAKKCNCKQIYGSEYATYEQNDSNCFLSAEINVDNDKFDVWYSDDFHFSKPLSFAIIENPEFEVQGNFGYWHVIDAKEYEGKQLYLIEQVENGTAPYRLIIDKNVISGVNVMDDDNIKNLFYDSDKLNTQPNTIELSQDYPTKQSEQEAFEEFAEKHPGANIKEVETQSKMINIKNVIASAKKREALLSQCWIENSPYIMENGEENDKHLLADAKQQLANFDSSIKDQPFNNFVLEISEKTYTDTFHNNLNVLADLQEKNLLSDKTIASLIEKNELFDYAISDFDKFLEVVDNLVLTDTIAYEILQTCTQDEIPFDISLENTQKQRMFVDMDGTLAVFNKLDTIEPLFEKGYFENLKPQQNVVDAVKEIINSHPEKEVFILSAYLSDSKYALEEKNTWLNKNLPEIDEKHRIFCPCGEDKKNFIPGEIKPDDFLLDDYTNNLLLWQPPAKGIKLLNGINHTNGTWKYDCIDYSKNAQVLSQTIIDIMNDDVKSAISDRDNDGIVDKIDST